MPKKTENINEVLDKLSALCSHLTDEQKEQLRKNITTQEYKKNEIIYREGERPHTSGFWSKPRCVCKSFTPPSTPPN